MEGFAATHAVPPSGLAYWHVPDAGRPADGSVDGGLPVQVVTADANGWAQVRFSNGWEAWVDERALVAAEVPATGGGFAPHHEIPATGLEAREQPDGASPPVSRVDGGVPVELVGEANGWTQVRFSNGWEAWIDGRGLVPVGTSTAGAGGARSGATTAYPVALWLPAAGAAVVFLGSLLGWYSGGGQSVTGWDVSFPALFDTTTSSTSPKAALPLLLVLGAFVPLLTRNPLPKAIGALLGGLALVIGLLGLRLYSDLGDLDADISLGIGLILVLLGAVVMIIGALRSPN